jgi:hypothetical protein
VARSRLVVARVAALVWGCFCLARTAGAQQAPIAYAEYRADAIIAARPTVQGGGGVALPLGIYVRLGVDGALGATWRAGDDVKTSGRVDVIGRFLLDPLREVPIALSLGGGVSAPYAAGDAHVRPLLVAVVDVEGRIHGAFTPALEVGLGGGARVGIVLRRSPPRWR